MLGGARQGLLARWRAGESDSETLLRLLFLEWYSCSEPGFLTGLGEPSLERHIFEELVEQLGGAGTEEPEVLFVIGYMAEQFPWCCGAEERWAAFGRRLSVRYRELPTERRMTPEHFRGKGAFGQYFAHIIRQA